MARRYKCPYCDDKYERKDLIKHIDKKHEELIPEDHTASRVVFNLVNKRTTGYCMICRKETKWREDLGRYDSLCGNPKCKQQVRENYKNNMLKVRGTYNILNDPEQQQKMLSNRRISGKYKFSDGGIIEFTGSYEKKFLEFMDVVMKIPSKDIISPGPTLVYEYEGKEHFYIPDFYLLPWNLIIEIKDGGDNVNGKKSGAMSSSRDKTIAKERMITDKGEYNYIRLTNNNFAQLIEILMDMKEKVLDGDDTLTVKINESKTIYNDKGEVVPEICPECGSKVKVFFKGEPVYLCDGCEKYFGTVPFKSVKESIDIFPSGWFDKYADEDIYNKCVERSNSDDDLYQDSNELYNIETYNNSEEENYMGYINENWIINKDNVEYNLDKFLDGKSNILLITGLSGSGKSTLATKYASKKNTEWIELDNFEHCGGFERDDQLKQAGMVFYEYLSSHKQLWERLKKKEIKGKDLGREINKFIHYCLRWCKSHNDKNWVLEGVQIYSAMSADEVKSYPIIIVGTSMKNSILQRFKRNGNGKIEWGKELKNEFPNLLRWYWEEEKYLKDFKKDLDKPLNESIIFNDKNIYSKVDKFESGESNVLLITGLSGSGKSTLASQLAKKYKCLHLELDCLESYLGKQLELNKIKDNEPALYDFINKEKIKAEKLSYQEAVKLFKKYIKKYIKFAIGWCKKHPNNKYIIEGLQIYETFEEGDSYITSTPLIIMGTSALNSSIRGAIRNSKITDDSFLKQFKPLLKWALQDQKSLNNLKKSLNESYITESYNKINYNKAYDTLIFDFGSVLNKHDKNAAFDYYHKYMEPDGITMDEFEYMVKGYFDYTYRNQNNKNAEAAYKKTLDKKYQKYYNGVLIAIHSMAQLYDYTIPMLKHLKSQGYDLYYLSNQSKWNWENHNRDMMEPTMQYFTDGIISCEVGLEKPDIAIYKLLLKKTGINPETSLFFDDKIQNIKAANKVGIDGVVFTESTVNDILKLPRVDINRGNFNSKYLEKGDMCYNLDKWDPYKSNFLFITGISGSGKTTLGKDVAKNYACSRVELDWISFYYLKKCIEHGKRDQVINESKMECPEIMEFFETHDYQLRDRFENTIDIISDFIDWFYNNFSNNGKLYIINGSQIVNIFPVEYFYNKPLIMKDINMIKTIMRRSTRTVKHDKSLIKNLQDFYKAFKTGMSKGYRDANKMYKEYRKNLNRNASLVENTIYDDDPLSDEDLEYYDKYIK